MQVNRRGLLAGIAATPLIAAIDTKSAEIGEITVFEAKKIVTMERGLPEARFVACAGGTILGVAQTTEALGPWTSGRSVKIDRRFADNVLFPGLIDPHIHPMQTAVMLNMPFIAPDDWKLPSGNWPGVIGQDAYRARLKRLVSEDPSDPLITWGHHELFHGPLDRAVLDEMSPDRPLFVWQRSFHEILANTAALESMGLAEESAFNAAVAAANSDPHHANFEKGIFSETALGIAIAKLRPVILSPEKLNNGFAGLLSMMKARGVTTTADLATGIFAGFDAESALIAGTFDRPNPASRVMLMPIAAEIFGQEDLGTWLTDAQDKYTRTNVSLDKRVKLFADGAFFAQYMQMGPPGYTDGHLGKWLTEPDMLQQHMKKFWAAGFSLHIHVNGDLGADVVLNGLAKLDHRPAQEITLEHLGYCTEAQAQRIADMGLMVSAQPNYIRVLGKAYSETGLGPDRASLMNRLGSLERGNVPLGLHSDFNMAPIDPFYLAWITQTREGIDGIDRAPHERLSREKALRAITIEAAQVIGMDEQIGSIAAGKKADFVALDADPFEVDLEVMKEMPINATVFEGNVA